MVARENEERVAREREILTSAQFFCRSIAKQCRGIANVV